MKVPRRVPLALVFAVAAAALAASVVLAQPKQKADVFKVAWIYPGQYNDGGWSTAHNDGRLMHADEEEIAREHRVQARRFRL